MLACAPVCGVQARGRGPCSLVGGLGNGGLSGICLDGPAVHCVLLPGQLPAQLPKCGPLLFLQPSLFCLSYCPSDFFYQEMDLRAANERAQDNHVWQTLSQENSRVGLASLDPVSLQQESWWQMRVVRHTTRICHKHHQLFILEEARLRNGSIHQTDYQSTHRHSISRRDARPSAPKLDSLYNASWFIFCLCSNKGLRSA